VGFPENRGFGLHVGYLEPGPTENLDNLDFWRKEWKLTNSRRNSWCFCQKEADYCYILRTASCCLIQVNCLCDFENFHDLSQSYRKFGSSEEAGMLLMNLWR